MRFLLFVINCSRHLVGLAVEKVIGRLIAVDHCRCLLSLMFATFVIVITTRRGGSRIIAAVVVVGLQVVT